MSVAPHSMNQEANSVQNFDKMINLRRTDEKLKGETLFCDGLKPANNPPHVHQYSRVDFQAEVINLTAATLAGDSAFVSPFVDNLVTHRIAYARVAAEDPGLEPGCELSDGRGGSVYAPPGIQMGASPYITHRDEAMFGAAPDVRRPECWIQAESGTSPREHELYVRRIVSRKKDHMTN
ncbi:putative Cytochrome P450 [Seiridium unicorne]|uniref:Cytochrome P450 n=1 Tax=Seiridium unicorne TaxID=138068 RepID=A0ABR2VC77_9PEZI